MATDLPIIRNVTFGSDVEFFVAQAKGKQIVSAEGYIPGTKKDPARFGTGGFATQLDNVLAEGNIPPAEDVYVLGHHMETLRRHLNELLKPHKLITVGLAAAHIPEKFLQTENAKHFGCDPSYNCWTLAEEKVTPTDPTLRSAGFHIHVGYDKPQEEINIAIARVLDACLGLAAVVSEPKSERRTVGYGKSGNFRHQPHGVEYRTLSSWFADRPNRIHWVFNSAKFTIDSVFYYSRMMKAVKLVTSAGDDIQEAINTDNAVKARKLLTKMPFNPLNHWGPTY